MILCDLAGIMVPDCGIDFAAFKQHRHVREAIARIVPGMEQLADIDVARREFHIRNRVLHSPQFGTPGGKARFVVTPLPPPAPAPLTLATVRSEGQFNTIIYEEEDTYRGKAGRDAVFLNRDDMAAFGVVPGQRVVVRSAQGRMPATATPFDLPRGAALAYFPEANVLTATAVDPRSRTPAFKSVPVWIAAERRPYSLHRTVQDSVLRSEGAAVTKRLKSETPERGGTPGKTRVRVHLDPAVVDYFNAGWRNWHVEINAVLARHVRAARRRVS